MNSVFRLFRPALASLSLLTVLGQSVPVNFSNQVFGTDRLVYDLTG